MDADRSLAAKTANPDANPLAIVESSCCSPTTPAPASLHEEFASLLSQYDVNAAAASVKIYAIKPQSKVVKSCCGPACCA
jgi:hypothetical protein